jgi:ABC-type glycerol-3-phosphate transport system substrate-binding protein
LNYGYFGFAADDPRGTFLLLLYLSLGGQVQNEQGLTILQEAPLNAALQTLKDGLNTRHFSDLVTTMQHSEQVWIEFSSRRIDTAFLPVDVVLKGRETTPDAPDPAFTSPSMTLTDAWVWALGSQEPQRQELAVALIAHLSETQFLAKWSEALKEIPARPSALGSWEESSLKPALEKMASGAVLYPPDSVMNNIGPILRNATLLILRDNADVGETTKQALESVK